jgi:hypothetical protein
MARRMAGFREAVTLVGRVCPKPRLSGPVCHNPRSRTRPDWGEWSTSPVYRGLCATTPERRQAFAVRGPASWAAPPYQRRRSVLPGNGPGLASMLSVRTIGPAAHRPDCVGDCVFCPPVARAGNWLCAARGVCSQVYSRHGHTIGSPLRDGLNGPGRVTWTRPRLICPRSPIVSSAASVRSPSCARC